MPDIIEAGTENRWPFRIGVTTAAVVLGAAAYWSSHSDPPETAAAHHSSVQKQHGLHTDAAELAASHPSPVYMNFSHGKESLRFSKHGAAIIALAGHGGKSHIASHEVGISFTDLHCERQRVLGRVVITHSLYESERTPKATELPANSLTIDCLIDDELSVVKSGYLKVVGDEMKYSYTLSRSNDHASIFDKN